MLGRIGCSGVGPKSAPATLRRRDTRIVPTDEGPRARGRRRALLVGSATYGLTGCNGDVALMRDVLTARGFGEIDVRVDGDATRAGILDGFDALVGAVAAGDVVVVYYSGHGGRVTRPDFEARKAAGLSVNFQFIVPYDMAASDVGDFRGITAEELTVYQRRLTDAFRADGAVPNVTTILDCCHAGFMARGDEAMRKAIDLDEVLAGPKGFRMRGIREHLAALGDEAQLAGVTTNPDVVRIVACQPEQSAYEAPSPRGGRHGVLTDALATVLEQLGDVAVPWTVAGDLVRRRVRARQPEQRSDVEGPSQRLVFGTDAVASGALPVTLVGGAPAIEAAGLLGLAVGDEFDVVAPATSKALGRATVARVDGPAAVLAGPPEVAAALAEGAAIAVPVRLSVPRLLVDVAAAPDELRRAVETSGRLAAADGPDGSMAGVGPGTAPGTMAVLDPRGARWRTADFPATAAGRQALVGALEEIAVGHRLLDLAASDGAALADVVEIGLVAVDSNAEGAPMPRSLPARGAAVKAGDRVNVAVRNTGAEPLFAWVFDVGVSGRAGILSRDARSGLALGPAGTEDDRFELWGAGGEELFWPPDVPTDARPPERWETFVVIVADQRADLSSLSPRVATSRGRPRSALEALVAEARGGTREAPTVDDGAAPLRYRIETLEFLLHPGG